MHQGKIADALGRRENVGQREDRAEKGTLQGNARALCHNAETVTTPRAGGDSLDRHVRTTEI